MNYLTPLGFSLATLALLLPASSLPACTSLMVTAADGGTVYGRTMEFGVSLDSDLIVIPRNYAFTGTAEGQPIGQGGLAWKSKYGATGTNFFGLSLLCEGINDQGLTGGLFYFPNFAEYQQPAKGDEGKTIGCTDVVTYVLTNFKDTDEIKAGLPKIFVTGVKVAALGNNVPPVHFSFHDKAGKSVVVEYTNGGTLNVYDNPTTVLTNAPDFPAQLNNLSQYATITKYPQPALDANGLSLPATGSGIGTNTLPGGYMPPARFVRAFFTRNFAPQFATSAEAVPLVFRLMNGYDIPPGMVGQSPEGKTPFAYEITEWTSSVDMKNLRYHIRTYANPSVRYVDLNEVDLDAADIRTISLDQKESYQDLSK